MIELYKRTHYTVKCGWSSDEAGENWDEMIARKAKYVEEGIEKTEQEIATEVLGHASSYIKGVGYGPKPPGKRNTLPDSNTQHLQQVQLTETQEKVQYSKGQVIELKNEVDDLNNQLTQQGECINKLKASASTSLWPS